MCLTPSPMAVPPGQPASRAYFSTGRPFIPGYTEVSVDGGPLRRGLDYYEGAREGWIGLDPTVEAGEVYVCFAPSDTQDAPSPAPS